MRTVIVALAAMALTATPAFAQEGSAGHARGYVLGLGGFSASVGSTSGDVLFEAGGRIAPHLMAFGTVGHVYDLPSGLQPALNDATSMLASRGLTVSASGTLPAWYDEGGLRFSVPVQGRIQPYALGALGVARLEPHTSFVFKAGTLPDGTTPNVGDDITMPLVSLGEFTPPANSDAFMFTLGGGVQVPLAHDWAVDASYRYSRIAADNTLGSSPIDANGVTFGVGYRF